MYFVQTDTSHDALVAAIRGNLYKLFRHLGRSYPDNYFADEKFARWHAPVPHPWFSGVLSSQLPEDTDASFIEDSIDYFRTNSGGAFTWWVDSHLKSSDWESTLRKHGFGFSNDTPGMAMKLAELQEPPQATGNLQIRVVEDDETLPTVAHIFTIGYGLPPDWEPAVYDLQKHVGLGYPNRNYLGYLDGEPVSTSCLFLGAGVAGIYNVATLPKARGKGLGAALTCRALRDAREMGYHIAILQSSELGFNLYKKLGFQHLCQIEYFYRGLD